MSLAPEHLADLRASGLTDDTIKACGFTAIRPHDLKLQGVDSAYRITYFDLEGKLNCVERLKLFPALAGSNGTQKYHQTPGTPPSLYMPPLFAWKAVARDARLPIVITEGEKKAAAGCQAGLHVLGIAGTWNWKQRLDTGERMMIPALDQFVWKDRPIEIVPDSDAWRPDKLLKVLGGFYALAQELISRGAVVTLVRLPEQHGGKVGLDDWLIQTGSRWETDWPALERISTDDPKLAIVAAWWQRWRDKHATQEAIRERVTDDLILAEVAGLYTVHSAVHSLTITFERLSPQRGGIVAEVSITIGVTELRSGIDLSLKSDSAQAKLAGNLKSLCQDIDQVIPWKILLPRACALVLKRYRRGAPVLRLDRNTPCEPLTFIVNPLILKRKPTVIFADGGKGKSTLALMTALLVSTGGSIAGLSAAKGRALYLDWEDTEDVHTRRIHALQAGHPELSEAHVTYLRCTERLARMVHEVARIVQQEQITLLVIDSLLAAAGGGSDAEATEHLFSALRVLDIATLIIGHTPKTLAEGQDTPTIYGSVFNSNFARSTWEIRTEQEVGEDCAILGLFHRKTNLTRKHSPMGLKVHQTSDGTFIQYESFDLNQAAEIEKALPLPNRIRNLLESDGTPRTSREVADELQKPLQTVKATLSNARYKGIKWQMIGEGREAKWTVLNR
ncbi:AAA family ATPase [Nitrospira sp. CMX1]